MMVASATPRELADAAQRRAARALGTVLDPGRRSRCGPICLATKDAEPCVVDSGPNPLGAHLRRSRGAASLRRNRLAQAQGR